MLVKKVSCGIRRCIKKWKIYLRRKLLRYPSPVFLAFENLSNVCYQVLKKNWLSLLLLLLLTCTLKLMAYREQKENNNNVLGGFVMMSVVWWHFVYVMSKHENIKCQLFPPILLVMFYVFEDIKLGREISFKNSI